MLDRLDEPKRVVKHPLHAGNARRKQLLVARLVVLHLRQEFLRGGRLAGSFRWHASQNATHGRRLSMPNCLMMGALSG